MGFSTSVVFALLFMTGIVVGTGLFMAFDKYTDMVKMAGEEQSDRAYMEVHTNIEITNISKSGSDILIRVKNTGSTVLNPDYVALIIDNGWLSTGSFAVTGVGYFNESSMTQTKWVYNYTGTDVDWNTKIGAFNETVTTMEFLKTNTSSKFYWEPSETLELTVPTPLNPNNFVVKVVVENGVSDEYKYTA